MREVSKLILYQILEWVKDVVNDLGRMSWDLLFILVDVLILHLGPVSHHIRRNGLLGVSSLLKHAA